MYAISAYSPHEPSRCWLNPQVVLAWELIHNTFNYYLVDFNLLSSRLSDYILFISKILCKMKQSNMYLNRNMLTLFPAGWRQKHGDYDHTNSSQSRQRVMEVTVELFPFFMITVYCQAEVFGNNDDIKFHRDRRFAVARWRYDLYKLPVTRKCLLTNILQASSLCHVT